MKRIKKSASPHMSADVTTYQLAKKIRPKDFPDIVDAILTLGNVELKNFRLSNSEHEYEHFFRTFGSYGEIKRFFEYDLTDYLIDDFGCTCVCCTSCPALVFHITIDLNTDHLLTFVSQGTPDETVEKYIIPVLNTIENVL